MKTITLLLGLLLGLAPAALAQVRPEISYVYYPVQYVQGKSVDTMIALSTPLRADNGHRVRGRINWWLGYERLTVSRPSIDVCQVADPKIVCRCRISLPQLQGGDEQTRRAFEKITADIREHELEHCRLTTNYANDLDRAFRAVKPRDCDELAPALQEIFTKIHDDCSVAQKRYDHSEYGYEQYLYLESLESRAKSGFQVAPPTGGRNLPGLRRRPAQEMQVLPQGTEELKQEGFYQDENGVWRNY